MFFKRKKTQQNQEIEKIRNLADNAMNDNRQADQYSFDDANTPLDQAYDGNNYIDDSYYMKDEVWGDSSPSYDSSNWEDDDNYLETEAFNMNDYPTDNQYNSYQTNEYDSIEEDYQNSNNQNSYRTQEYPMPHYGSGDRNIDNESLPRKRAKYHAQIDQFLTNGIIIVGVLLLAVLLIAFLG